MGVSCESIVDFLHKVYHAGNDEYVYFFGIIIANTASYNTYSEFKVQVDVPHLNVLFSALLQQSIEDAKYFLISELH
jgi:hypothetical protein